MKYKRRGKELNGKRRKKVKSIGQFPFNFIVNHLNSIIRASSPRKSLRGKKKNEKIEFRNRKRKRREKKGKGDVFFCWLSFLIRGMKRNVVSTVWNDEILRWMSLECLRPEGAKEKPLSPSQSLLVSDREPWKGCIHESGDFEGEQNWDGKHERAFRGVRRSVICMRGWWCVWISIARHSWDRRSKNILKTWECTRQEDT